MFYRLKKKKKKLDGNAKSTIILLRTTSVIFDEKNTKYIRKKLRMTYN